MKLLLLWHFHQPPYIEPNTKIPILPFVRLHVVSGYTQMLEILKKHPSVNICINITPVLLEQVLFLCDGKEDFWMNISEKHPKELSEAEQQFVVKNFFSIHYDNIIKKNSRYAQLFHKRELQLSFSTAELMDIQTLFNLAWISPLVRKNDPALAQLWNKGTNYSQDDKKYVLNKHRELLRNFVPLLKDTLKTCAVELTASPFYHEIIPLLKNCAGAEYALGTIRRGVDFVSEVVGTEIQGVWLPELATSNEALDLLKAAGIRWTITNEDTVLGSRGKGKRGLSGYSADVHTIYERGGLKIYPRDRILSDRISFNYAGMKAEDSVSDLMAHLMDLKVQGAPQVTIALDGENAWEHFHNYGIDFLQGLYSAFEKNCETVCPGRTVPEKKSEEISIAGAGSWINNSLSVWGGSQEDLQAWKIISEGLAAGIPPKFFERAFASDWYWWYGPEFFSFHKDIFDLLFRTYAANGFVSGGKTPPASVFKPIGPRRNGNGGRGGVINPVLDGKVTNFFEWLDAECVDLNVDPLLACEDLLPVKRAYFGKSSEFLFVRIDPRQGLLDASDFFVVIIEPAEKTISLSSLSKDDIANGMVLEARIPLSEICKVGTERISFVLRYRNVYFPMTAPVSFSLKELWL